MLISIHNVIVIKELSSLENLSSLQLNYKVKGSRLVINLGEVLGLRLKKLFIKEWVLNEREAALLEKTFNSFKCLESLDIENCRTNGMLDFSKCDHLKSTLTELYVDGCSPERFNCIGVDKLVALRLPSNWYHHGNSFEWISKQIESKEKLNYLGQLYMSGLWLFFSISHFYSQLKKGLQGSHPGT